MRPRRPDDHRTRLISESYPPAVFLVVGAATLAAVLTAERAAGLRPPGSVRSDEIAKPTSDLGEKETLPRDRAEQLMRTDAMRGAQKRAALLALYASLAVSAYWMFAVLAPVALRTPRGNNASSAELMRVTGDMTAPFAESSAIVLPSLVTILGALAVVKVIGWASTFVVSTSGAVGVVAVVWAVLSGIALVDPDRQVAVGYGVAASSVTLAAICLTVSAAVPLLLPSASAARANQLRQRAEAIDARRTSLAPAARVFRRFSDHDSYSLEPAANRMLLWYGCAAVVPFAIVVLVSIAMALASGPEVPRSPDSASGANLSGVWVALVVAAFGVAGLGLLHFSVLAHYSRARLRWMWVTVSIASGTLLLAAFPAFTVFFAVQQGQPVLWSIPILEASWAVLLWLSALVPIWVPLRRVGAFGQVVVALAIESANHASRDLNDLRRAESQRTARTATDPSPAEPT